jgi:predicted molibdopterin-dependent oxidoreductase YjgC
MTENVNIRVNGRPVNIPAGTVVAAAIARAGLSRFRSSVSGQSRGPLCGMGICMECCVTINGRLFCRSCQILCEEGMEVVSDG